MVKPSTCDGFCLFGLLPLPVILFLIFTSRTCDVLGFTPWLGGQLGAFPIAEIHSTELTAEYANHANLLN